MYVISESLLKSYKKCDALITSQKYFYLIHMAARQQPPQISMYPKCKKFLIKASLK